MLQEAGLRALGPVKGSTRQIRFIDKATALNHTEAETPPDQGHTGVGAVYTRDQAEASLFLVLGLSGVTATRRGRAPGLAPSKTQGFPKGQVGHQGEWDVTSEL